MIKSNDGWVGIGAGVGVEGMAEEEVVPDTR